MFAEAGAGAGADAEAEAGAEGQPGMRSPRFVSLYEWSSEYPVEEECARVTRWWRVGGGMQWQ